MSVGKVNLGLLAVISKFMIYRALSDKAYLSVGLQSPF